MNAEQLRRIMPYAGPLIAVYLPHLTAASVEFGINSTKRQAAWIAQLAHESAQLAQVEENLYYSAAALMKTWPKRFPTMDIAAQYARQPQKIANFVYANRMGNGDEASGDGFKYRGSGLLQLTGKEMHAQAAQHFSIPLEEIGPWLRSPRGASRSAAWFWSERGCNALADKGAFIQISKLINGGTIGLADRLALTDKALEVFA